MQCVILAAGEGTRLRPLTLEVPKALVPVSGKPLINHIVEALPSAIDEIFMVTGYREEQIKAHCGSEFCGRKVTYVHQEVPEGTAAALFLCKDLLNGRFLIMLGDDIHGAEDIARAVSYTRSILVSVVTNPERFGVVTENPDGTLAEVVEKPTHAPSNLASTGTMVLDEHIFEYDIPKEGRIEGREYYLTDVLARYAKDFPIAVVEQTLWIPIGYPEDIEKAEKILTDRVESERK
ncbi:NTP transferase domain-containing protein [Candidatus Kaiserbacteria bacterium]|nr:NTP transferase domain-containing protein [Candidatus Kaiserbacteria bacterium]